MAWTRGQQDPESGLYNWTDGGGAQRWAGADGTYVDGANAGNLNASTGPSFGSPWANDRTGWTGANADALFDKYARSEAGAVGAETLEGLRKAGVSDDAAIEALWKGATGSANPDWAGGSPTGIKRGIWEHAGVLGRMDSPALRAAQSREDQEIWAGQQKNGDDGFGSILGIAGLALAIYTGGAALGAWGAEGALLGAGEGALSAAEFGANAGVGQAALEPSFLSRMANSFTPEKIATDVGKKIATNAIVDAVSGGQSGLISQPGTYGYNQAAVAKPPVVNSVPASFAMAASPFDPKFNRT